MRTTNYSSFRANLKTYLDEVEENDEMLVLNRGKDRGTVIISLSEYNSLQETSYLLGTEANANNLRESIAQADAGETFDVELVDYESKKGKKGKVYEAGKRRVRAVGAKQKPTRLAHK